MTQKLLSIIIPTYNRPLLLENCLTHVAGLQERGLDCEVVIVDSSEGDDSRKIAEKFGAKYRWFEAGDDFERVTWKMYVGLNEAEGVYAAYLADDDYLIEDKLKETLEFLQKNPQIHSCITPIAMYDDETGMLLRVGHVWGYEAREFNKKERIELANLIQPCTHFVAEHWIMKTDTARTILMDNIPYHIGGISVLRDILWMYKIFNFGNVYMLRDPFYRYSERVKNELRNNLGKNHAHFAGTVWSRHNHAKACPQACQWFLEWSIRDSGENSIDPIDFEVLLTKAVQVIEKQFNLLEAYEALSLCGFLDSAIVGQKTTIQTSNDSSLWDKSQILVPTAAYRQEFLREHPELKPAQVIALEDVMNAIKEHPDHVSCAHLCEK